jgi:hypothetical protein
LVPAKSIGLWKNRFHNCGEVFAGLDSENGGWQRGWKQFPADERIKRVSVVVCLTSFTTRGYFVTGFGTIRARMSRPVQRRKVGRRGQLDRFIRHSVDHNRSRRKYCIYNPANPIMQSTTSASGKTPGLFYVNSKITEPSLSAETFNKWYDEIHVPDILATSGIKSAFRYYGKDSDRPFLALYPLEDVHFLESQEFHSISSESEILPKTGLSFDVASFDTRPLVHIKTYQSKAAQPG